MCFRHRVEVYFMINSIVTKTNSYPIQTVQALAPVGPVYYRDGNTRNSDLPITSEINNLFALAIEKSFAQMGIFDNPAKSSGNIFSSEPERQVLIEPFMNSLLDALQSQNVLPYQSWIDTSLNEALQPLQHTYSQLSWVDLALNFANSGIFGTDGYQEHNYNYQSWMDNFLNDSFQPFQNTYPQLSWVNSTLNFANAGMFGIEGYQGHNYYLHGENDGLQMDLQRLIQKVSSIDSVISVNGSNLSAPVSLLLDFQKLIGFAGQSISALGDIEGLGHFLKTLSKNVQGVNSSGNFINIFD